MSMNMTMRTVPAGAGSSRIVRENVMRAGRRVRLASIEFTTRDGFVGLAPLRHGGFREATLEAYEAACAARAKARYEAVVTGPKPAPLAPLLSQIRDTFLCSELERRGYEVVLP